MSLIDRIFEAGIVGQGGAGFPTHVKFNAQVNWLVINGLECEPLLHTDKYIMRHNAHDVVKGIEVARQHLGATRAVIGIKGVNHAEIDAIQKEITAQGVDIQIFKSENYYPSGDEQMLVYDVTQQTVPAGGIPLDVGVVVSNVGTMQDIYNATQGNAITHKYLTVTGEVVTPSVLKVPIGTSFSECIALCGGSTAVGYRIINGGPLMGSVHEQDEELFVTKTTSGIILIDKDNNFPALIKDMNLRHTVTRAKVACIQCRQCTDLCPRHLIGHKLHPHKIMRTLASADHQTEPSAEFLHTHKDILQQAHICCGCGICEVYACPMGLLPRQVNLMIKGCLAKQNIKFENKGEREPHIMAQYRKISPYCILSRMGLLPLVDKKVDNFIDATTSVTYCISTVNIALKQHIGQGATPVVNVGDTVQKGQLIGEASGNFSANIHASIDGTVKEVGFNIKIQREGA